MPVDDIVFNERDNDLVLGTHGRSIIILDDISPLEHLDAGRPARPRRTCFRCGPRRSTTRCARCRRRAPPSSPGPNPAYGALITYYLRDDPKPPPPATSATNGTNGAPRSPTTAAPKKPTVKITVLAADGSVVRELEGPDRKGLNRIAWDLRYALPFTPAADEEGWFGPPKGTFALPGEYTIKLTARGRELSQKVTVRIDPRAPVTTEGLQARFRAARAAAELQRAFMDSAGSLDAIAKELEAVNARIKERPAGDAVTAAVKEFSGRSTI